MIKKIPRLAFRSTALAAAAVALFGAAVAPLPAQTMATPSWLGDFPNFNPMLATALPGDVDVALKKKLEAAKKFPEVQREFDLWSWQAFVTLNWPTNDKGEFAPNISDTAFGPPKWTGWYESTNIFREDGGVPAACHRAKGLTALSLTRDATLPAARDLKPFALPQGFDKRRVRLLGNISAVGERSPATRHKGGGAAAEDLDDILQAFTAPLIDQNGNFVFYEIQIDPNEVGYICENELYNVNGQIRFTKGSKDKSADLPRGADNADASGAWELKFAWRVLVKGDDRTRYLVTDAIIPATNGKCPDGAASGNGQCAVQAGLVGMHIGHKSQTSPQWIWSTFEQVDNLAVDNVAHPNLKPSFFDPGCPICVTNQPPAQNPDHSWATSPATQVARAIPIPADKLALNAQAQAALEKAGSALRYYQLIDSQWPTDPTAAPTPPADGLPGAIENKSGGQPTPVFLTNATMETYFQTGAQQACNQEENQVCPATPWLSGAQKAQRPPSDSTLVFGSESCMGCHSSAGLYINPTTTSGQLRGDFSWLFAQKAKPAKPSKP